MSVSLTHYGIVGQPAPEFRLDTWLSNVAPETNLTIADIDEPVIYLYNFQAWCPGCHSHGFPTLAAVKAHFEAVGRSDQVKFVAVQTVFEGHDQNTEEAAIDSLARHDLTDIALGHDSGEVPTIMTDYRTGGTPWTVLVGPDRTVLADGFQMDSVEAIELIESALADAVEPATTHPDSDTGEKTMTTPNDAELRKRLTPEQYKVTQKAGTERAFSGEYWDTKTDGVYRCVVCDAELFGSDDKFDSGTGWPSFTKELGDGSVSRHVDRKLFMKRTEARCGSCDAHLGHVFSDGPRAEGGERYCMNSAALVLEESGDTTP